jgi:mannose-1-phosphate guanylyltransferase
MTGIVLAGGSGTRFWPLSRRDRPKQLLTMWRDGTMLEQTVDRLSPTMPRDQVLVVCGPHLVDSSQAVLDDLDDGQFVVEPAPRDTAPAIALAAAAAEHRYGDTPVAIFPADHVIDQVDRFHQCLQVAGHHARQGAIVTMGIEPTRPETGYGYIHADRETLDGPLDDLRARPVHEFVEKPDRNTAQQYVDSGNYLWNSGMFVFTPSTLFEEMARQQPEMAAAFDRIRDAWGTDNQRDVVEDAFKDVEAVSIDFGIMEGARDVTVVPADFDWSDVGHWAALPDIRPTDEHGNVVEADAVLEGVSDSIIVSEEADQTIAGIDLDHMIVVQTDDALLVCPTSSAQKVKQLVQRLEDDGLDSLL